jgi:PAS domain S-box-containing protein
MHCFLKNVLQKTAFHGGPNQAQGNSRVNLMEKSTMRTETESMDQDCATDRSRPLLAAIVDSSDDAIISKNLDGIITSWNKGAQKIFGYTAEEAVGRPVMILIPPDRAKEEMEILSRIKRGERIDHYETIRRARDGRLLNISLTVSPVKDGGGKVIGASKIARDITERKRVEQALKEAQRQLRSHADDLEKRVEERTGMLEKTIAELETFSYSLSHDLRAPLRAIRGFLEIVLEDHAKQIDAPGMELMHRVVNAAERMDRMILDLQTFTRISQEPMAIVPVDMEKLIRGIIREQAELQSPHAEITMSISFPEVMGNEASLTQCVMNLLDNAVKFVAPNVQPRIHIYSEHGDDTVRFWFEDNGIGIDMDARQKLFQMFQRVHGNEYPGTGIGLAIVRKAVERMSGKTGLESEPGKGSRFWLQLPGGEKVS